MKDHLAELAERRVLLQRKAAAQREQLGEEMDAIDARIRGIDNGIVKVRSFVKKPLVFLGGGALLWFLGPRRALGLASKAAFVIPLARRLLGRYL